MHIGGIAAAVIASGWVYCMKGYQLKIETAWFLDIIVNGPLMTINGHHLISINERSRQYFNVGSGTKIIFCMGINNISWCHFLGSIGCKLPTQIRHKSSSVLKSKTCEEITSEKAQLNIQSQEGESLQSAQCWIWFLWDYLNPVLLWLCGFVGCSTFYGT